MICVKSLLVMIYYVKPKNLKRFLLCNLKKTLLCN